MTSPSGSSPWFIRYAAKPDASFRLWAFPHAGAGPSFFRPWAREMPAWVDVLAVQLPGREGRRGEPPAHDLGGLVDALAEDMEPFADRPYALFGHSVGAVVAFELARRLSRARRRPPSHLFVAGYGAPHTYRSSVRLHLLPREEVIDELKQTGGTPDAVLASDELMGLFIPLLRADLAMGAKYRCSVSDAIATPITAFGGQDDPYVTPTAVADWSDLTHSAFRLCMVPGGHFFPAMARSILLDAIVEDLSPSLVDAASDRRR